MRMEQFRMKEVAVAIVTSMVIGWGAIVLAFKYNEGETNAWRASIDVQMVSIRVILKAVQENQIELATRASWMTHVDKDLLDIELRLSKLEEGALTKEDAVYHNKALLREIELLWATLDKGEKRL